ncbi:peptidase S51 [Neisseriaceae bacterium PsAf]|nr:peptidase S51 [Neisseriaceae bacterium PsAf]MCV2502587.1 Type 1 glutamine amidotransferase-like domain-containing protein [Neisseriaceae bacterium]
MKRLFLTSYLAGTKNFLAEFLDNISKKEVVFIPTAANVEVYKNYLDDAKKVFHELDYKINLIDIAKMPREEIITVLDNCQCVYFSGGNSFYLLQELKRKQLIDYINDRVTQGMSYIGESAGAVIAAKNIEYVHIMDDKSIATELLDYDALSLIDFYIVPHYQEFPFADSSTKTIELYEKSLKLVIINNSEAIAVYENVVSIQRPNT